MNKQADVNEIVREGRARREAEQEALHVRNVVPIVLEATVVAVVVCLSAIVLVVVLR